MALQTSMRWNVRLLSLNFKKLAKFFDDKYKRICQNNQHINQGKEQGQSHYSPLNRAQNGRIADLLKSFMEIGLQWYFVDSKSIILNTGNGHPL
jgi:predicted metallo-beta-lactamase superfamily hydrolase